MSEAFRVTIRGRDGTKTLNSLNQRPPEPVKHPLVGGGGDIFLHSWVSAHNTPLGRLDRFTRAVVCEVYP